MRKAPPRAPGRCPRLYPGRGTYETEELEPGEEIAGYAEALFRETARRQALTALHDHPDREALADYFARINAAYFAGRLDSVDYDTDQLEEWEARDAFLAAYLKSMAGGAGRNCTTFSFTF